MNAKSVVKIPDVGPGTLEHTEPESLSASTLKMVLMEITLDELKASHALWHLLAESEQGDVIDRIEKRVVEITRRALELFATSGLSRVCATLESVTVKDGIKGVVSLSRHDAQRHSVMDAQGQTVFIVLANPEQFTDAPHGLVADADQRALDLDQAMRAAQD